MGKFLKIFGGLALLACVLGGIGFAVIAYNGSALDASSKMFVDNAVPAIAANWNPQALLDRSTPELRAIAKPDAVNALFARFSQFGPLVRYEGAKGHAGMYYTSRYGSVISAMYVAKAEFQNGAAIFRLGLRYRDKHWLIQNFHVDRASASPGSQA